MRKRSNLKQSSKKVRGMARRSLELIEAMHAAAEAAHPITGRGVGYKLFAVGLIDSMDQSEMQRVYRLLKEARERDMIPWRWIVDQTRELERRPSWKDPAAFVRTVSRAYRRDYWNHQPVRVVVGSEKGTCRGLLAPILDKYGVGFRVMHGFSSATTVYDVAQDYDGCPLIVLYVGDYDPSGLYMSEHDLPNRFAKYGGDHVILKRVALRREHTQDLPSFPASDKKKDPRYRWFIRHFGNRCWELDALDPNELRALVEAAIRDEIEPIAWDRCAVIEKAEAGIAADRARQLERRAMTAVIRFPPRRIAAVFICRERDGAGWLALVGSSGWLHGSRTEALAEAKWLSRNFGLPVREVRR
jgi:hypothetical protein